MEANSLKHFYDALNAARAIQNFIADKTFEDYLADELLAAGVERKFEIIGEAFNRIRKEADRYPPARLIIHTRAEQQYTCIRIDLMNRTTNHTLLFLSQSHSQHPKTTH